MSVKVSMQVKNAKTIQYIIHLTWDQENFINICIKILCGPEIMMYGSYDWNHETANYIDTRSILREWVQSSLFLVSQLLRHTHIFLDILGPDRLVRGVGRVEGAAK